jgi:polar amino acid transport system substrate-binding protein
VAHWRFVRSIDTGGCIVASSTRGVQKALVAATIGTIAVVAAACSSNSSSSSTTAAPTTTASTVALPTATIPTQAANAAIAATVPASVKAKGTLNVALDATYPPDEFIAPDGSTIVGMDADLATAITQVLGLKAKMVNATFSTIIPGIQSGKYDLGASSFTDTIARQKVVDFVDYFTAGEGFYVKSGSPLAFNGLTTLCGHSVAVESGTVEQTDAQAQAKTCTKNNKGAVTVLTFGNQSQGNLAVSSGRADVGFADSQVAGYIVATSNGVFQNSGTAFSVAPYGLALPKGNGMAVPVQSAVNLLIGNGVYSQILTKWGVQSGAVTSSVVNGATS